MPSCLPRRAPQRADLAAWPSVESRLLRQGTYLDALAGEDSDDLENRIGTRLMVLYRDTREQECFEALYAFSRASVLSWIKSLLGRDLGHVDPTEVLQDTFVNVYRYPASFREEHAGSFRVWVRTIAGNVVRRASASRSRIPVLELGDEEVDLRDGTRGPVETATDEEQEQRLRKAWILLLCHYAQAWKELSQRDRRTLHLVEVEGLSYQEAGRLLAVGRSNMKMIVFRSRKRIARRMREAMVCGRGAERPELVA